MPDQFDSTKVLQESLSDVLTKWPLYRAFAYTGKTCHSEPSVTHSRSRFGVLPKQIRLFCDHKECGYETLWEISDPTVYFGSEFINRRTYECRNCGQTTVDYCFIWSELKPNNVFVKIGQYPKLEERVPDTLKQSLGNDDLELYKKALRMRNFGLGVAAVAYLRRIIENRMNDMLEILHEAAITHNAPAETIALHKEMKGEKRFSVKVNYAGDLLPATLRPPGKPNPMAVLHDLASDGLHAKSDDECVDIFDACRRTFEYVFGKLRLETEDARNFVKEMSALAEKRTKRGSEHVAGEEIAAN